ncbi:hypothetical protein OAX11_05270 [Flavobacteriaceae bacterium]|nr:hypothetical protein [Flavobacteriaceae bacterium]
MKKLKLGNEDKKDKIVLIEQLSEEFDGNLEILDNKSDTLTDLDVNMLYTMTYKDTVFIKRISKEKELRKVIVDLSLDKSKHLRIKSELLEKPQIEIESISYKKYDSFFGNGIKIEKGWRRINKKYGTYKVVDFSQVRYNGRFASTYYGIRCGGLCGSGNIVVFERVNGKWKILTEINLWMS